MAQTPPQNPHERPIWVAVVSPHPVIRAGIEALLRQSLDGGVVTTGGPVEGEPDVVLYDVIRLWEGDGADLDLWVKDTGSTVVAITRELRPDLGALALGRGAHAALSLAASAEEIEEVVLAAAAGTLEDSQIAHEAQDRTRPGGSVGLSGREAYVLGLIAAGLSNHEIAESAYITVNSVKTYIRSAYRKIGVTNRAQAVAWALLNGFPPPQPSAEPDASTAEGS